MESEEENGTVTFFGVVSRDTVSALNLPTAPVITPNNSGAVKLSYIDYLTDDE